MPNHLTTSREINRPANPEDMREKASAEGISEDLLKTVLPFSTRIPCASGDAVIRQGETESAFFYINEGMLEVSFSEGRTRIVVAMIAEGNFIGEIGFLDGVSRVREARAIGKTVVMKFSQDSMDRLLAENPTGYSHFILYLARAICWKFRRAIEEREPVRGYAAALSGGKKMSEPIKPLPDNFFLTREGKETSGFVEEFKAAMFDLSYRLQALGQEELPEDLKETGFSVLDTFKAKLEQVSGSDIDSGITPYVWGYIFKEIFPYFMRSRFAERVYYKPRGYAGDYLMIDMIYNNQPAGDGKLGALVDAWALAAKAPEAVRGRRALLADQLEALSGSIEEKGRPLRIMNLACGPCREVADFLSGHGDDRPLEFLLVDIDTDALRYADSRLHALSGKAELRYVNENIIKWALGRSRQNFGLQDIIYSSGLTDYLEDRLFIKLVDRCHERLTPGGVFLVGNFGPRNPDRAFMDHILEWNLIYRSEEDLKELFSRTSFKDRIQVLKEPLGVNLFVKAIKA